MASSADTDGIVAEQLAYYRARAPEYTETAIPELPTGRLKRVRDATLVALDAFRPSGDVLELACGPGTWTPAVLEHADRVTAVDGAPEMLQLAAAKVGQGPTRFIQAELFSWEPDQQYDAVFFAFWLSHVPLEHFEAFWGLVDRCLNPGGRVAFVDDAYRAADELIEGESSALIRRELSDGTVYRLVKVTHTPASLEQHLARLGWEIKVRWLERPFFWGEGRWAGERPHREPGRR